MIIQTGRNRVIVDDGFKTPPGTWVVVKGAYACLRSYDKDTGQCRAVYLHRHITSAPRGKYVDHINRNPLDNRSRNLRVVNCLESAKNRAGRGYSWSERDGKFSVNAQLRKKEVPRRHVRQGIRRQDRGQGFVEPPVREDEARPVRLQYENLPCGCTRLLPRNWSTAFCPMHNTTWTQYVTKPLRSKPKRNATP